MSETALPPPAPGPAGPSGTGPSGARPRRRRLLVLGVVLLVLTGAAVAGVAWWRGRGTELDRAVDAAPPTTERLSWVDWAAVRAELDADLGPDPGEGAVADFLGAAFEADLSSTSALVESTPALQRELGLSPATAAWESFAQSEEGVVITVGAGEVDLGEVADRLERAGWRRPAEEDGVWVGGADLLATLDPGLTPLLAYVVVLADEGLVLAGDDPAFLEQAVEALRGDAEAGVPALVEVAEALTVDGSPPLSASLLTGGNACEALAMAQADDSARAEADALVEAAGGEVRPYTAIGTALLPGGGGRVAMAFETEEQARAGVETRARLAVGPAPGQGGSFPDRFALEEARAEGRTVVLDVDPEAGTYFVSDLSNGPVLYATC